MHATGLTADRKRIKSRIIAHHAIRMACELAKVIRWSCCSAKQCLAYVRCNMWHSAVIDSETELTQVTTECSTGD